LNRIAWKGGVRAWRALIAEKWPLFALSAGSIAITLAAQKTAGAVATVLPFSLRLQNAFTSYVDYILKMFWPANLAVFYPYERPSQLVVAAAIGALSVLTALAVRAGRRRPYLLVGWFWYGGMLIPVIGLIQAGSQRMADRYSYLPLIGLFIIIAWGVPELIRSRAVQGVLAGLALLACATAARGQVRYWENNLTLWTHTVAVTSDNMRARNNLGVALADHGRYVEAITNYREALRIQPVFPDAMNNLGNALAATGKPAEAEESYRAALRINPGYIDARTGLASVLDDQGRISEAFAEYQELLRMKPDHAAAHNNFVAVLVKMGKLDDALREALEAVSLDGSKPDYHYNAGALLRSQGREDEARRQFEAALKLNPDFAEARTALGAAR
jgi:Tfp pilus assembly protein PilF